MFASFEAVAQHKMNRHPVVADANQSRLLAAGALAWQRDHERRLELFWERQRQRASQFREQALMASQDARSLQQLRESAERDLMRAAELCSRNHWAAWTASEWETFWDLTAPVMHLTSRDQTQIFSQSEFEVSPKADGVRCLVLSDAMSGRVSLIDAHGAHPTPYVYGLERGFLLDAEMVNTSMGARLVLAFDVLRVEGSELATGLKRDPASRRRLLEKLVLASPMPQLLAKPFVPMDQTLGMWNTKFPYPIDGLIFTPDDRASVSLKWKPVERLSVDFAVGAALRCDSQNSVFELFLYEQCTISCIPHRDRDEINPFQFGPRNDLINLGTPVMHFRCFIDADGQMYPVQQQIDSDEPPPRPAATVLIPNEHCGWASHRIIEAVYTLGGGFSFVKIRFDKNKANSFRIANSILAASLAPLSLSELIANIPQSPYRSSDHVTGSKFRGLRRTHAAIKRMLYMWHGGRRIVDACAGGLHDLENWIASGVQEVLAIDRDYDFVSKGAQRVVACPIDVCLRQLDLSENLGSQLDELCAEPYDAAFCHFALHYMDGGVKMQSFLSNMSSLLRPDARFVVSFMRGELVRERAPIQIRNSSGAVEFEVMLVGEDKCRVFVASIGRPHIESLVELDPIIDVFSAHGFAFHGMASFDDLGGLLPSDSAARCDEAAEGEMISLYAAAVFKKRPPDHERRLPNSLLQRVLGCLDTCSLVKARRLGLHWRATIDSLQIKEPRHAHAGWPIVRSLTPSSVGLMLRMKAAAAAAESSDDDDDEYSYGGYSDISDCDLHDY